MTAFLHGTGGYCVRVKMPRLEEVANVVLRVPSILVLDMLYKCDIDSFTDHLRASTEDMLFKYKYVIWNIYYLGKYYVIIMSHYIVELAKHAICEIVGVSCRSHSEHHGAAVATWAYYPALPACSLRPASLHGSSDCQVKITM